MKGLEQRKEIKETKAAQKVVGLLDEYRVYFRDSRGKNPEQIHISQTQKKTLGIDTPFRWRDGIMLKLTTDE